jgi:acetoin utilization deacetylase AcuC-like enzyme
MDAVVVPTIRRFDPELLIISAGYDAAAGDPLGGMLVTEAGFAALAERVAELAPRLALVLEGGYDPDTLPGLVAATLDAL